MWPIQNQTKQNTIAVSDSIDKQKSADEWESTALADRPAVHLRKSISIPIFTDTQLTQAKLWQLLSVQRTSQTFIVQVEMQFCPLDHTVLSNRAIQRWNWAEKWLPRGSEDQPKARRSDRIPYPMGLFLINVNNIRTSCDQRPMECKSALLSITDVVCWIDCCSVLWYDVVAHSMRYFCEWLVRRWIWMKWASECVEGERKWRE